MEGVGSGLERVARLSEAAHVGVELPYWCAMFHSLRRDWKVGMEELHSPNVTMVFQLITPLTVFFVLFLEDME